MILVLGSEAMAKVGVRLQIKRRVWAVGDVEIGRFEVGSRNFPSVLCGSSGAGERNECVPGASFLVLGSEKKQGSHTKTPSHEGRQAGVKS